MRFHFYLRTTALLLAALVAAPHASAAVIWYQNRAEWEAAAAAAGLATAGQTFDSFADTYPNDTIPNFSAGPVSFSSNNAGTLGDNGLLGGQLVNDTGSVVLRSGAISGPRLFGLGFDHSPNTATGASQLILKLMASGLYSSTLGTETSRASFIGFLVTPNPVTGYVTMEVTPMNGSWASFDNMIVAYETPEPATFALVALGIAAVACRKRRTPNSTR